MTTPPTFRLVPLASLHEDPANARKHPDRNKATVRATMLAKLEASQSDARIKALYARLSGHPLVSWKESIKEVVGIDLPTRAEEGWAIPPL